MRYLTALSYAHNQKKDAERKRFTSTFLRTFHLIDMYFHEQHGHYTTSDHSSLFIFKFMTYIGIKVITSQNI